MALGGGTFVLQNKELSGAYINFVSAASANPALSDRGIAAMPIDIDWGVDGDVFEVTNDDFQKNSLKIFGYAYTDEKMKGLRDLFLNAKTLYTYRLNSGGTKASNEYAEALYGGERGNSLKIVVKKNADEETMYDVQTVLDTSVVDIQTVKASTDLVANDFVKFKEKALSEEDLTAAKPLTGGTNGTVNGEAHQKFIDLIEPYSFNTLGVITSDETVKSLYAAFQKRMRDEMGVKWQLVIYGKKADYMGTINVKNKVLDAGADAGSLVYWVTGAEAGCAVNKSLQNTKYDGEFTVDTKLTQTQLKQAIKDGEFTFHMVGSDVRVLEDINSMVTTSDEQGDIFKDNQTIRVIDQIGNDIAVLFNTKYLGVVPNDNAGRISLWSDIVKHHKQLNDIRAIENFSDADVVVTQGNTKKSVVVTDAVTVVNAMSKLYMTVTVA